MIGKAIDGEGEALLYVLKLNEEGGKPGEGKPPPRRATSKYELEVFDGLPRAVSLMKALRLQGLRPAEALTIAAKLLI